MSLVFEGEYLLPASIEDVWQGLNEPEVLRRSIAGCTQLESTAEHEFLAVMTAKVGPIAVDFRGVVQLQDITPLQAYTLVVQAKGGAAGFGRMKARIELHSKSPGQTQLHYSAQAEVGGKLASVGQRLIQSVAQKQANDFFSRFSAIVSGQEAAPPVTSGQRIQTEHTESPQHLSPSHSGLGALVPAWLVVFGAALGAGLGYCLALLR
jgi:carbon monoxide dehydrogenase subunit G